MKKIRHAPKEDSKRKEKLVLGVIIAFIMVSSILGYFGSQGSRTVRYNGHKFRILDNGMYSTQVDGQTIGFNFLPQHLGNMSYMDAAVAELSGKRMAVTTSDPQSKMARTIAEAEYLLVDSLFRLKIYPQPSYLTNGTDRPVASCLNATEFVPVILIEQSNETTVEVVDHCVVMKAGNRLDFLAFKDRLIYGLLGILE